MHEGVEDRSDVAVDECIGPARDEVDRQPAGEVQGGLDGERRARILEGVEGQGLDVLRLHVSVADRLEELDLHLVCEGPGVLDGSQGQSVWFSAFMSP